MVRGETPTAGDLLSRHFLATRYELCGLNPLAASSLKTLLVGHKADMEYLCPLTDQNDALHVFEDTGSQQLLDPLRQV
jgi:hypothetical protein